MSLNFIVGDTVEIDLGGEEGETLTGEVTRIEMDADDVTELLVEVKRPDCSPNEFARDDAGTFDFITKVEE